MGRFFNNTTSDKIDFGTPSDLSFERTSAFSVFAWLLPGSTSGMYVFGKGPSSQAGNPGWQVYANESTGAALPNFAMQLRNGGSNQLIVRTGVMTLPALPRLVSVLWIYSGGSIPGSCGIYVNGVAQSLTTVANTLSASVLSNANVQCGVRGGLNDLQFNGPIAELQVFDFPIVQASDAWALHNRLPISRRPILHTLTEKTSRQSGREIDLSPYGHTGIVSGTRFSPSHLYTPKVAV